MPIVSDMTVEELKGWIVTCMRTYGTCECKTADIKKISSMLEIKELCKKYNYSWSSGVLSGRTTFTKEGPKDAA